MIYKDGGCNYMYCKRCKTHFDWDTLSTQEDSWNPPPQDIPATETLNFNTYSTAFLRELGYRIEENEEPIPCEVCQRLCLNISGMCADRKSIYRTYIYIDGLGERDIYNRKIHYCHLCRE